MKLALATVTALSLALAACAPEIAETLADLPVGKAAPDFRALDVERSPGRPRRLSRQDRRPRVEQPRLPDREEAL